MSEAWMHDSAVVDDGAVVGSGTKVWHFCHISTGARIGRDCSLGQNVFIGEGVVIGDGVKIQNNVSVYSGVTVEDDVFLGPSCVFTNVARPRSGHPVGGVYDQTLVRRGATIGANSTIVCGVTIGAHAFVAAGAVVTHDVPDFALVMGNPARVAGWACECGQRLEFGDSSTVACSACGLEYARTDDGVVKA